mgnify:CR=1 FL=1
MREQCEEVRMKKLTAFHIISHEIVNKYESEMTYALEKITTSHKSLFSEEIS